MSSIVVSFFILFGGSYGVSSILLKKGIKMNDHTYKPQVISTKLIKISKSKSDWFV